jgi:hypothetical protein
MGVRILTLARIADWRESGGCCAMSKEDGVEHLPWVCALRDKHSGPHDFELQENT